MPKPKNICIGEPYTDGQGEKKMNWNRIGVLFVGKNGKEYMKLNHIPGVLISVFPPKEDQAQGQGDPY